MVLSFLNKRLQVSVSLSSAEAGGAGPRQEYMGTETGCGGTEEESHGS